MFEILRWLSVLVLIGLGLCEMWNNAISEVGYYRGISWVLLAVIIILI